MSKNSDMHDDVIYTWYDLESDRLYLKRNGVREEVPPITRDYIRDLNDRMNALWSRCDDAILSNGRWMKRYAKLMRKNAETQQQLNDAMESMGRVEERCAKLREQMERLVTLLRNDCDIEASWDGLRRFWSIELTEDGCLMRDRACKAEAENAKLRERVDNLEELVNGKRYIPQEWYQLATTENARLREFVADLMAYLKEAERVHSDRLIPDLYYDRARELGVEVTR